MVRIILALLLCWTLSSAALAADATHGAEHGSATAAEHGAAEHGGDHGAAQKLSPIPTVPQAIAPAVTTLVVFALLLAVLGKFAWGPIATGLKAREDKIRKDIADAEAARARSEATLAEYNQRLATAEQQVRELMSKAAADAEKIAANVRMQAQKDSEEIKERATRDIDAARKQAMVEFREYAATVATNAAEQILRRNLNADDQRDLVNRSLDQLQTVKA
jgi:F-type H+-transporting ATPase subunit b